MPLEELIHEGWVHGASQWTLLQSWQVANTKVGGIWTHHPINTRMNSLRAWIPGSWQLKLLQTIPPKCNWKMDLPPPAGKSSGWRWTDSCSGCETPSCGWLSALWWCCSGVQVLATGTGDCCAIPSGGQEQQGPGHSSERAGKWTFAVRVHYPTFQQ